MAVIKPRAQATPATDIHRAALRNLQYIRGTIDAAGVFTSVPGRGGIAMGVIALVTAALAQSPGLQPHWITVWLAGACVAIPVGGWFLAAKLRRQQQTVFHGSVWRFFRTLMPALLAGALLTVGLLMHGATALLPSVWLLGYGAGVLATGSFCERPVTLMGAGFMLLGLAALFTPPGWSNVMLALGFGGLHIVFGWTIALKSGE